MSLEAAEALIRGAALRTPERLADRRFADEVTDLLVRYLARDATPSGDAPPVEGFPGAR